MSEMSEILKITKKAVPIKQVRSTVDRLINMKERLMSTQLSLFGEPNNPLKTPSEYVAEAIPLVAVTIDVADVDGLLSELQAVHVAISALKRAATRFDPAINDWRPFAVAAMKTELRRSIERGETRHQVEVLAEMVFGSEVAGA